MLDNDLGAVQVKAGVRTGERQNVDSPKIAMKDNESFSTFGSLEVRVNLLYFSDLFNIAIPT